MWVKEKKGILIWTEQMWKPKNFLRFKALRLENKNGAKSKVYVINRDQAKIKPGET